MSYYQLVSKRYKNNRNIFSLHWNLTIYYFLSGDFPAILGIMPILLIIVHVAAKKS